MQFEGHQFGLTRDAIETVAKEELACCVDLELEVCVFKSYGVLSCLKLHETNLPRIFSELCLFATYIK